MRGCFALLDSLKHLTHLKVLEITELILALKHRTCLLQPTDLRSFLLQRLIASFQLFPPILLLFLFKQNIHLFPEIGISEIIKDPLKRTRWR